MNTGMRTEVIAASLCLAVLSLFASVNADVGLADFPAFTYTNAKYTAAMPYRLFIPKNYVATKKYPLVCYFHEAGCGGGDNTCQIIDEVAGQGPRSFADSAQQVKHPCFVLAPQGGMTGNGDIWVNQDLYDYGYDMTHGPTNEILQARDIIALLVNTYSIDTNRIYVTGASMGGLATWELLFRYPKLFAAGMPVMAKGDATAAKTICKIPIWNFCGDQDFFFAGSKMMIDSIIAAGGTPKFSIYPGLGHGIEPIVYPDTAVHEWVFRQVKGGAATSLVTQHPRSVGLVGSRMDVQSSIVDIRGRTMGTRVRVGILPTGVYVGRMSHSPGGMRTIVSVNH